MKILNLEWESRFYRDRVPSSLVANYLRLQGHEVVEGPIFEGYSLIRKFKPDLIFKAGYFGAVYNFRLMEYAHAQGIPLIMMTAEGNCEDNFWRNEILLGLEHETPISRGKKIFWSERTRSIVKTYIPAQDHNKLVVGGGAFFDLYKLFPFMQKADFLKKFNKTQFSKVIGFGCWDFGLLDPKDTRHQTFCGQYNEEFRKIFSEDHKLFNEILLKTIEANPNILFVIKKHPGEQHQTFNPSATAGVEKFPNVVILKNEIPIGDVINVCDVWISYESTTSLEAWLLGKPTASINPTRTDFPRPPLYKGSPNFKTSKGLCAGLESFFATGTLPGFKELSSEREKAMLAAIQWSDGLNHVRSGNVILNFLDQYQPKDIRPKLSTGELKEIIKFKFLSSSLLKSFFPRYDKQKKFFSKEEVESHASKLRMYQTEFYKKAKLVTGRFAPN